MKTFMCFVCVGILCGQYYEIAAVANVSCAIKVLIPPFQGGGLGHLIMSLLAGIDIAYKTNATLRLDRHFWQSPSIHSSDGYTWARTLFPVKLDSNQASNAAVFYSTEDFLQNYSCNVQNIVHTGTRYACANSWCSVRSPGLYYRGAKLLKQYFNPATQVLNSVSHGRKANRRNHVLVLWHVRVGDTKSCVPRKSLLKLKSLIDSSIPLKKIKHVIVSENNTLAKMCIGDLDGKVSFDDSMSVEHLFYAFLDADVLVSLGSSLTYGAGLLSPKGKQILLYFPPVVLMRKASEEFLLNIDKILTKDVIRASSEFRTMFLSTNFIPVDYSGQLFPEYKQKYKGMASSLNRGVVCSEAISDFVNESWL